MGHPAVSVIVPVFNGEKYISECINSILSQSFRDFELIIIDDGSTDDTENICKCFLDGRIRYFRHKNTGVSFARKKGLSLALGKYISFVDGDDTLEKDFLKTMVSEIINKNCDIACCNSLDSVKYNTDISIDSERLITDKSQILSDYFNDKRYTTCIWGKLYKKEILGDVIFPDMKYAEDTYVIHQCYQKCVSVSLLSYYGYIYRDNPDGAMRKYTGVQEPLDVLKCNMMICRKCIEKYPQLAEKARSKLTVCLFACVIRLSAENLNNPDSDFLIMKAADIIGRSFLRKNFKGNAILLYLKYPDIAEAILRKYYLLKHGCLKT